MIDLERFRCAPPLRLMTVVWLVAGCSAGGSGKLTLAAQSPSGGLTEIKGLRVGHHTLSERPTGCTVVLAEAGVVAGVDVRGSAPGTRETALLDPVHTIDRVHAIVLSGGSAFGLDAASGAVRYLEEHQIGFDVRVAKVPIVPAAILFDLGIGGRPEIRPGPECGYQAAKHSADGPVARGSVGAGAGATVGKMQGMARAVKGGIGSASIRHPNGLLVAALIAVNAVGDVIDPSNGEVVAGIRREDGAGFTDVRRLIRSGALSRPRRSAAAEATTIGVVATNAVLTKTQATKVAQMAHDGLARAIVPAHTPSDGDVLFALATGGLDGEPDVGLIGALAAEVVSDAILDAVRSAVGVPGVPAISDLETR